MAAGCRLDSLGQVGRGGGVGRVGGPCAGSGCGRRFGQRGSGTVRVLVAGSLCRLCVAKFKFAAMCLCEPCASRNFFGGKLSFACRVVRR